MRQIIIIIVYILIAASTACTDEISFDYSSVEPLPVIEGYVQEGGVVVLVTTTRDVTDSSRNHFVDDAVVRLAGPGGREYEVPYGGCGRYSLQGVDCVEGGVYTLSVTIGGQTYTASDTMAMASVGPRGCFVWEEIMETDYVSYRFAAMTPVDSLTNYVVSITRNGDSYIWAPFNNYAAYDGLMDGRLTCFSRDDVDGKKNSHPEDVIQDGDEVEVLIAGVSRRAGTYYYELMAGGETSANPGWTFSGGKALGIFAARNVVRMPAEIFRLDKVAESFDPSGAAAAN